MAKLWTAQERKWYVGYRKSPRLDEFERMKAGIKKTKPNAQA